MTRLTRRPRPDWCKAALFITALHPAMSFCTAPSTSVAWRIDATKAGAIPRSSPCIGSSKLGRRGLVSLETRAGKQQYLNGEADVEGILEPSDRGLGDGKDLPELSENCEGEAPGQSARWEPPDRADRAAGIDNGGDPARQIERHDPKAAEQQAPPVVARSLESVRSSLIRQEETIIFSLIEREQFGHNPKIYTKRDFRLNRKDVADIYGRDASFLEYMLCETEKLHATGRHLLDHTLYDVKHIPGT